MCGSAAPATYSTDAGVRQKFTGKELDSESGLDYFGARYFATAQGRFSSPDAALTGQGASNPQSWNLYAYVTNNPLRYVDPTGHYQTTIDGVPTDRPFGMFGVLGGNGMVGCPNNACTGWGHNNNGEIAFVSYGADANGTGGYSPITPPMPDPTLPKNQIYAAFLLAARFGTQAIDPNKPITVVVRYVGTMYNVQIPGDLMNIDAADAAGFRDPLTVLHQGNTSYYIGRGNLLTIDAGHVVNDVRGIEAHFDSFGPYTLQHNLFEALPSLFFNTRAQANAPGSSAQSVWSCSMSGGCRPQ
jgi:RHS repeat-associated protein